MGKLAHLMPDQAGAWSPVIDNIAGMVAQNMAEMVAAAIQPHVLASLKSIDQLSLESASGREKATQEIQGAINSAVSELGSDMSSLRTALKRTAKMVSESSNEAMRNQSALISVLGDVTIPDHSDQLHRIEAAIPALVGSVQRAIENNSNDSPTEWDFAINRNRNGFIQSVTAKAK